MEGRGRIGQITDFAQKRLITRRVKFGVLRVPRINLGLQIIAFLQQSAVARRKFAQEFGEIRPKLIGFHIRVLCQYFILNKIIQMAFHLQTGGVGVSLGHGIFL